MRYDKKSDYYVINMESFHEMELVVPMTKPERDSLRNWVRKGYDIETNPWDYHDVDDYPLNYLQAYRLKNGYSSGPWDYWKGPDTQGNWDDDLKCFYSKDDYC